MAKAQSRGMPPTQPSPERREHAVASPNGTRLDPYFWLRDDSRKNKEVLSYLRQHNAYTRHWLRQHGSMEGRLYREIVARLKQDDQSVPYRKNGYWYYSRYETGKEYPVYARRQGNLQAPEQIMLDVNEPAAAHSFYQIGAIEISGDGEWMAYCEDTVGRREFTLRFKNLASGETLSTQIPNVEADLAWLNDGKSIFYIAKDPKTLLGKYVRQHRLGTDPAQDALLFEQSDPSFYTTVMKSKSDRYVFLGMESTVSSEWRYADANDATPVFKTVLPHERDHEYQIEHWGCELLMRTNWNASNFRLMRAPLEHAGDRSQWRDLLAHREDTFIEDFEVLANFVAVSERSKGLQNIRVKRLDSAPGSTGQEFFIEGDEPAYTMALATNTEIDSNILRYSYTSLKTPATVYDYDLNSRERTTLKQETVLGDFDPANYDSEFLFAQARDGKSIPISLVYRKGLARDGTAALLQYGYGAYGHAMDPGFSSSRLSLLDRGFVFALAHVRGGQELGRAWYDGGRLLNKQNTFHDFIDVTRHLVAAGYAAKDRVFAMGGSAGGLLMGAIANLAPQDYRGILAQVPFVDVVTTMLDDSVPLTTNEYDEWGNPRNKADYDYMLSYSPYDNVKAQHYPAMFVTTGLWDSQVQYYEPAKWVAKLAHTKLDSQPLLLRVDMKAGHGGKSGRFQHYREIARDYAFILAVAADQS